MNNYYRMVYEKEALTDTEFKVDLKDQIVSLSPKSALHQYCPIEDFRIYKVINKSTRTEVSESLWSKWFSINSSGVFTMLQFEEQYFNQQVVISVFNGDVWFNMTDDMYIADISLTTPNVVIPTAEPTFEEEITQFVFQP